MTVRGVEFLENWIKKNVTAADHEGGHQRASALAQQCASDAVARGIALEELEPGDRLGVIGTILDAALHLAKAVT